MELLYKGRAVERHHAKTVKKCLFYTELTGLTMVLIIVSSLTNLHCLNISKLLVMRSIKFVQFRTYQWRIRKNTNKKEQPNTGRMEVER